jgi:hypothetical protein
MAIQIETVSFHTSKTDRWVDFLATLDTGADENWISSSTAKELDIDVPAEPKWFSTKAVNFSGGTVATLDTVLLTWCSKGERRKTYKTNFNIVRDAPFDVLFGKEFLLKEMIFTFDKYALFLLRRNPKMLISHCYLSGLNWIILLIQRFLDVAEIEIMKRNRAAAEAESSALAQQQQAVHPVSPSLLSKPCGGCAAMHLDIAAPSSASVDNHEPHDPIFVRSRDLRHKSTAERSKGFVRKHGWYF